MQGLMMDMPLMLSRFIQHAAHAHGTTEIVARDIDGSLFRYDYASAHLRTRKLAQAIERIGIGRGERVGTLAWNTHRHFEMFYGVSGSGAVLHTVNPRLHREQLIYIINHCEDKCIFFDLATRELVADLAADLDTVQGYCLMCAAADMPEDLSLPNLQCYESLLDAEDGDYEWPDFDEHTASSICYTSGTTGNPKGIVYSHRAMVLTTLTFGLRENVGRSAHGDRSIGFGVAPMFHGNGWNMPYSAPAFGSKLVLPGRAYDAPSLVELFESEQVNFMCGVPTLWLILLDYLEKSGKKLPHLKTTFTSGAAPPRWMVEKLKTEYDVDLLDTWGMTECLGGSTGSIKPGHGESDLDSQIDFMTRSGRPNWSTQIRIVDDTGQPVPHDGESLGHLQTKGHSISSGYFKSEGGSPLDAQGWFNTGDVAVMDEHGYLTLRDRSKDVIKSGGEWISSVELENIAVGHPKLRQAAVISVRHEKWQERPLLVCVRVENSNVGRQEVLDYLADKVAPWWLPEDVAFVETIPMTGTGKMMKATLRAEMQEAGFDVCFR